MRSDASPRPPVVRQQVRPVLTGVVIAATAVAAAALVARSLAPLEDRFEPYTDYDAPPVPGEKPRQTLFGLVWAPAFVLLTISGLKVWFAPRSPARTQALTLWGLTQALNAAWMALGPSRLGGRVATTVASLGSVGAYAWRARRADLAASRMAAPYSGWLRPADGAAVKATVH